MGFESLPAAIFPIGELALYFDNENEASFCIEEMTREIWKVIRLVLAQEARQEDIRGATEKAKYLRLYIASYESRNYSMLPESSIWLAKEMIEAVVDLID